MRLGKKNKTFERWNDRGSRETGKFFSQPVRCGAKRLQLLSPSPPLPPFLSLSLFLSLLTHRQGRSFSVSAHTPVGQHHLESTDTKLIERSKSRESFTGPAIRHRRVGQASSNKPLNVTLHQSGMIYVIKLSFV